MNPEWLKCTRQNPCQICSKHDWCTVSSDGQVACCMRVQSTKQARNGGWIHKLSEPPPKYVPRPERPRPQPRDIEEKYFEMLSATDPGKISELALRLGVAESALARLGCAHAFNSTFAFPMKDQDGAIIGIRLRSDTRKWAVEGSRAGLFYEYPAISGTVLVTEGPTDAAAALTLGFQAIGRPSCRGQEQMLAQLLARNPGARVVLVPDKDSAGMDGSRAFAQAARRPMRRLVPPAKDLRQWLAQGATRQEVLEAIGNTKWIGLT